MVLLKLSAHVSRGGRPLMSDLPSVFGSPVVNELTIAALQHLELVLVSLLTGSTHHRPPHPEVTHISMNNGSNDANGQELSRFYPGPYMMSPEEHARSMAQVDQVIALAQQKKAENDAALQRYQMQEEQLLEQMRQTQCASSFLMDRDVRDLRTFFVIYRLRLQELRAAATPSYATY